MVTVWISWHSRQLEVRKSMQLVIDAVEAFASDPAFASGAQEVRVDSAKCADAKFYTVVVSIRCMWCFRPSQLLRAR